MIKKHLLSTIVLLHISDFFNFYSSEEQWLIEIFCNIDQK